MNYAPNQQVMIQVYGYDFGPLVQWIPATVGPKGETAHRIQVEFSMRSGKRLLRYLAKHKVQPISKAEGNQ